MVAEPDDGAVAVRSGRARMTVTLSDLWDEPIGVDLAPLDRADAVPAGPLEEAWQRDGLVILPGFLDESAVDAYCEAFDGGWGIGTPYMVSAELRDLACSRALAEVLERLLGEPAGLHLNLTWWRSTEREWHQDGYLNPPDVGGYYAAVWMALADIHPDSGPFEFVPGSHRWPALRRAKVLAALGEDGTDPDWPWRSELLLSPLVEAHITATGLGVERFVAAKGDVLVWHPRLMHRGSRANVAGMERRALISHYSGLFHRPDMPPARQDTAGGWYFPL